MKESMPSKIEILEEIIALDGKCLKASRCMHCPLRDICHPTFYSDSSGESRFRDFERVNHASEILTNAILMGDEEYERKVDLEKTEGV